LQLYYYAYYDEDPVGKGTKCYRLVRTDWVELEATWNSYKSGSAWTTPGAGHDGDDHDTTYTASVDFPADFGWMEWDVKAHLEHAQANAINALFFLRLTNEAETYPNNSQCRFYSNNEAVETTKRPKLVIEYGEPHYGAATITGSGSLSALGQVFKLGSASLSGAGTLTTAAVAMFAGKAALAGAGSLAASGRRIRAAAATLSGRGSLTASAIIVLFGKATLSGVGTLSAQAIRIVTGIATLAGIGLLSAAARVFGLLAALQAAQKKADRLPYVEAKIYDFEQGIKRLSWTRLYEGSEPDNHHGIAFDGQGAMHRIRADTGWAEGKLIGEDDHSCDATVGQDYIWADKFTASVTGVMDQFRIKVNGAGNVKVAVYADDAGEPGALLNAVNAGQAVTAGWNTISFPSTQLTSGTGYWLAFITDAKITCRYTSGGKVKRYKAQAYAGYSFEDPAPDMSNMDGYPDLTAGWRSATADSLLYRQKVSSPGAGSDYSQWTLITDDCHGPCAIAASGSKIYIFYRKGDNTVRKYYSHNYGVDWTDAELSTYADVLSMAAAWWAAGDIVVCFCAKATQLNAVVLDTSDQSKNEYTHSEPVNHPLLNTYGIGATYETDHMAIIFAGKEDASPYDFYALYRTQLSNAYNWLAWEYFITSPHGEDITFEYPDCHIPSSPQDYEQVRIAAVEKFAGSTACNMPLICHAVTGSTFQEMAYTEPKPFLNILSTYGLRFASTASFWWLERPDGVWQAPRAAGEPSVLTDDIISLTHSLPATRYALVITLDNSSGQHATPPKKRSEVVLQLGYKTTEGNLAIEVGRYWIDGWEYSSSPNQSLFTIYCLDGHGLSRKWSARYQMRWNQSAVSPKTVSDILAALLCRWGIYYYNAGKPRSDPLDNLYPDFIVQPGTAGDAAVRRLLSMIPDGLIYEGCKAYPKDLESSEASSYTYGTAHTILKGSYGQAVTASRIRAIGRDAGDNRLLSSAFDWDLLALGIDDFDSDYDPNLVNTTRTQERADAILRRHALEAMAGQITVPANVGQELYDVITVTDDRCGISGTRYRIIAIQTHYDRPRGAYHQALTLCAP